MRHPQPMHSRYAQDGFTLLEVLIAIIVLSVGLLGMAGLQATSLRNNHDAYLTTQATYLANDMADRIRANAAGLPAYTPGNPVQHANCGTTSGCTSTEMAENDWFEWNANVANFMPAGQGRVTQAGNIFTITVMWDELRNGATGTGCNPNVLTDLRCVSVVTQP